MTEPAATESLDDKIARLKRELADAEIDKAGDGLAEALTPFDALLPDFWEEGQADTPTAGEIQAAADLVRDAWARFEAWRATQNDKSAEERERRPYLALAPVAASAPAPVVFQKRPSGSGSTYRSGNGWKWRLQVAGNMKKGRTWPTREEAETELALAVADPTFVPVKPDYKRLSPTSKHRCSRCGADDHKANRCPVPAPTGQGKSAAEPTTPEKAESRAKIDAAVAAARAAQSSDRVHARIAPGLTEKLNELEGSRVFEPEEQPRDDALLDDPTDNDGPPAREANGKTNEDPAETPSDEGEPAPPGIVAVGSPPPPPANDAKPPATTKKSFTPPGVSRSNGGKKAAENFHARKAREESGEEEPAIVQRRSDAEVAVIVEKFIPLAHKVARRFMWATAEHGLSIGYDDLFGEAQVGILMGARGWEEGAGESLTTHLYNRATWKVHRMIGSMRLERYDAVNRLKKAGGVPAKFKSADAPIGSDEDSGSFLDQLADGTSVEHATSLTDRDLYLKLMNELPARTREILRMRFVDDAMLDDVGKKFSISRERARQIESSAFEHLQDIARRRGFDSARPRRWSPPDGNGRRTHIACNGDGCSDCDHDGYLWADNDTDDPGVYACGLCGRRGHNRATCDAVHGSSIVEPSPPAATAARIVRAAKQASPCPTQATVEPIIRKPRAPTDADPSNPDYIHPGRGWGHVGADGVAVHQLCNGTGKIRIKGKDRGCYPCLGSGRRECSRKASADEERRTA